MQDNDEDTGPHTDPLQHVERDTEPMPQHRIEEEDDIDGLDTLTWILLILFILAASFLAYIIIVNIH